MAQYTEKDMTPFFPADVAPAYVGMYEREYKVFTGVDARDYWDGKNWFSCFNGELTEMCTYIDPDPRPWRGLSFDPSSEDK